MRRIVLIEKKTYENRSDMAIELAPEKAECFPSVSGVKKTEVRVDKRLSARLARPMGRYITYESAAPTRGDRVKYKPLIEGMARSVRSLSFGCETFLAVGIGNSLLTADALGSRVVSLLKVNRCRPKIGGEKELSAFAPGVSGVTGIDSFDFIKSVTSLVKPDCVIVIDSLASASVGRLGTAFQISDGGLTPGSGVGGGKRALSASALGVKKTVSIGVPLVVYAETIVRDALNGFRGDEEIRSFPLSSAIKDLIVTPKDIDLVMSECAHIIAEAINAALF